MRTIQLPMPRVPDGASMEVRRAMFDAYCLKMAIANPHCYLPIGVTKRWYHFQLQHPLTKNTKVAA